MGARTDKNTPGTSRIGKRPIELPKGVVANIEGDKVHCKGPKGTLSQVLPPHVSIAVDNNILRVAADAPGRDGSRLQGLGRALVANMVRGVSEGYRKTLELHGTGYRAELTGKSIHFTLGYSPAIDFPVPDGVTVNIPGDSKGAVVHLEGADKAVIGQTAATIRSFKPPEPYGGKGIRYRGERVREKAGKAGK